jgi:acyl carrier protein
MDRQVKIGANRIELGEIENVLNGHPDVGQAHISAVEVTDGPPVLIAHCVLLVAASDSMALQLAAWLRERLPAVMVPHRFVFARELPLTANGKIDATRMGAWSAPANTIAPSRLGDENADRRGRSSIESRLIRIWQELLQVDGIGSDDSFANLGGDSLRVIRLQTHLNRVFGAQVSVADLLKADRMKDLVRLVTLRTHAQIAASRHRRQPRRLEGHTR